MMCPPEVSFDKAHEGHQEGHEHKQNLKSKTNAQELTQNSQLRISKSTCNNSNTPGVRLKEGKRIHQTSRLKCVQCGLLLLVDAQMLFVHKSWLHSLTFYSRSETSDFTSGVLWMRWWTVEACRLVTSLQKEWRICGMPCATCPAAATLW